MSWIIVGIVWAVLALWIIVANMGADRNRSCERGLT